MLAGCLADPWLRVRDVPVFGVGAYHLEVVFHSKRVNFWVQWVGKGNDELNLVGRYLWSGLEFGRGGSAMAYEFKTRSGMFARKIAVNGVNTSRYLPPAYSKWRGRKFRG